MRKIKIGKTSNEAVNNVKPFFNVGDIVENVDTGSPICGVMLKITSVSSYDRNNGYEYFAIGADEKSKNRLIEFDGEDEGVFHGFENDGLDSAEASGYVKVKSSAAKEAVSLGQLDGVVVGGGGPVNTANVMKDFEENLKKLEDLVKPGKITKTIVKNNYTVKDGKVEGSLEEKEESIEASKIELEKAEKSAKESIERNAVLRKTKPVSKVTVGLAGEHAPRTYPDLKDSYYGYAFVQHPFLGDFYVSMGISGDVRTDGRPWNFLQEDKYRLTDAQKEFVNQYRKELARQAKRGDARITIPLVSDDSNLSPEKYSLEAYEAVATELDATLPKELLNDPSEVNFKKILGVRAEAEKQRKLEEEAKARRAEAEKKAAPIIEEIKAAPDLVDINDKNDKLSVAFDELVPDSGKADTLAGEIVRATMRVLYRFWNDGDIFYEGYGLETVAPSIEWLADNGVFEIEYFEDWANEASKFSDDSHRDDTYEKYLIKFANDAIHYILDNPETFSEVEFKDSRAGSKERLTWVTDLTPKYDFDIEIPYEVQKHINAGNITDEDLESEVYYWEPAGTLGYEADEIYVNHNTLYIIGVDRDVYDVISEQKPGRYPVFYEWLEEYGETLDNEYGDPDEEDEEDYDEEYDEESAEEDLGSWIAAKKLKKLNSKGLSKDATDEEKTAFKEKKDRLTHRAKAGAIKGDKPNATQRVLDEARREGQRTNARRTNEIKADKKRDALQKDIMSKLGVSNLAKLKELLSKAGINEESAKESTDPKVKIITKNSK